MIIIASFMDPSFEAIAEKFFMEPNITVAILPEKKKI